MKRVLPGLLLMTMWLSACEPNSQQPGWQIFPDMVEAVPDETYAPNPVTPDGKTLQPPAPGSIPRGFASFPYAATPEEAERAGRELANPVPATPENLARGAALYATFCLVCHGPEGHGDGPLIPKFPNPPSFTTGAIRAYPPGRIYHVITRGAGIMASYAVQLVPEDRWKVALHVQSLQAQKRREPPPEAPPAPAQATEVKP